MTPFVDLHTHHQKSEDNVIQVFNLLLSGEVDVPIISYTAGLHPWHADQLSGETLALRLDRHASCNRLLAFGETGLDKSCKVPISLQQDVLQKHLEMAVKHGKPLILHCVRGWDELIESTSGYEVIKILHGFNGSTALTDRLVKAGFRFSIGKAITLPGTKIHESLRRIPLTSLFCETDDSETSIQAVYHATSQALALPAEELREAIFSNFKQLSNS